MNALHVFDPASGSAGPLPPTVAEIIDRYLRHSRATKLHEEESFAQREQVLLAFVARFGPSLVKDCAPYQLADWIEENPKWRSTSTKKARANMVNAAFNWAARQRRIPENPFAGVNYEEAERRPVLDDGDLAVVLVKANKRYESFMTFLRLTGRRLSEAAGLTWADVDFERGTLTIHKHKGRKKTKRPLVCRLLPEALAHLRRVMQEDYPPLYGLPDAAEIVFKNNRGTAWNRGTVGQQLRRMKERHGIKTPGTTHGIRHQYATARLRKGGRLEMVSKDLGHASPVITHKFYDHVANDEDVVLEGARQALPEFLREQRPTPETPPASEADEAG